MRVDKNLLLVASLALACLSIEPDEIDIADDASEDEVGEGDGDGDDGEATGDGDGDLDGDGDGDGESGTTGEGDGDGEATGDDNGDTTGGSEESDGSDGVCLDPGGIDACLACTMMECCADLQACLEFDDGCTCVYECWIEGGAFETCVEQCDAGRSVVVADVADCAAASCPVECSP